MYGRHAVEMDDRLVHIELVAGGQVEKATKLVGDYTPHEVRARLVFACHRIAQASHGCYQKTISTLPSTISVVVSPGRHNYHRSLLELGDCQKLSWLRLSPPVWIFLPWIEASYVKGVDWATWDESRDPPGGRYVRVAGPPELSSPHALLCFRSVLRFVVVDTAEHSVPIRHCG